MKLHSIFLYVIVFSSIVGGVFGQSGLHCMYKGSWLPVVQIKGHTPYLFSGDSMVKGDREEISLLSAADFGEGFIDVEILSNNRDGVVKGDGPLRFVAESAWYHLKARIVSDIDMEECFFAMRFDTFGKESFYCKPIGRLVAGKPRIIEIFTKLDYELPEQLHIFSGAEEIRSTLVPTDYAYEGTSFVASAN